MPERLLFVDTETGGIDPSVHSLLSIGLAVWEDGQIIAQKEIFVNDGVLNVTRSALLVNQINMDEHIKHAVSTGESLFEMLEFIDLYFAKSEKITLAGHNVNFDREFLKVFFARQSMDYHLRFSHRSIDTASILYFLYLAGIIKSKAVSSDDAFSLFSINVGRRHSALGDAVATAMLFTSLLATIKVT